MLPVDIIALILEFHRPMCILEYTGRPEFTLYWVYDIKALKKTLNMPGQGVEQVNSTLGVYFKSRSRRTVAF